MLKTYFQIDDRYNNLTRNYDLYDFSKDKLYGFIFKNDLVLPKNSYIKKYNERISNLDFAVDDLIALQKTLEIESKNGRIPVDSVFNSNKFSVIRGFENPIVTYQKYIILHSKNVLRNVKEQEIFYSFNSFFKFFQKNLVEDVMVFSDFIKSSFVTIFSSGLCFQIFKERESPLDFFNDRYFSVYYNICKKHNFNIDKYNPWIITRHVDDYHISQNIFKYNDIYTLDVIITYEAIKMAYISYTNSKADSQDYPLINTVSFDLERDLFYKFYIKYKLKNAKIEFSKKQFSRVLSFFKKNAIKNTIKDSVFKIDNITAQNNTLFQNRE